MPVRLKRASGFIFIILFLFALRFGFFEYVRNSYPGRRPLYSECIDLSRKGVIKWDISKVDLASFNGHAILYLSIDATDMLEIPSDRHQLLLRMRIGAYPDNDVQASRLVIDDYFDTSEPFSKKNTMLSDIIVGNKIDYCLGKIHVVSDEKITVQINIDQPDSLLLRGHPRLKLIQYHDKATRLYYDIFWLLRDVLLIGCVILLVVFFVQLTTRKENANSD